MTEDLRNRVEAILNSALEEIDISDIMSSDSRTELIVDALEEKIEENDTTEDLITEDISVAYITPGVSGTNKGVTFSVESDGRIKIYGSASTTRKILCLNGQGAIIASNNPFDQTFPAGTYSMSTTITGPATFEIVWRYTHSDFSTENLFAVSSVTPEAVVTFDAPVMFGIGVPTNKTFGTEENPTYITFTATKLSAIDFVARDAIDAMTVDEGTAWN